VGWNAEPTLENGGGARSRNFERTKVGQVTKAENGGGAISQQMGHGGCLS
jgi:hypothetical protein